VVAARLAGLALISGIVCTQAGVLQLALTGPRTWPDAFHGGYGVLALAQAVLPLAATLLRPVTRRASTTDTPAHDTTNDTANDNQEPSRRPVSRPVSRPVPRSVLWSAGAAVLLAVAAGTALATVAPAPAGPVPGQPLLRPVLLGDQRLGVLVTPMRPGLNLVHLSAPSKPRTGATAMGNTAMGNTAMGGEGQPATPPITVAAGGSGVTATTRPYAPGLWALINIPAGTHTLTLTSTTTATHDPATTSPAMTSPGMTGSGMAAGERGAPVSATVPVDVGSAPGDLASQRVLAGPDGPECVSAQLGALLAQAQPGPGCPAGQLTDTDAASLTDTVAFLAHQHIHTLDLVSDTSPRSLAAAGLVRTQAARWGISVTDVPAPNDTLLVVSGWSRAAHAVTDFTARVHEAPSGGAVVAPWLATGPILDQASSETVPLTFNPQQRPVREYVATVSAIFPGGTASPAGYLAWAAHTDPAAVGATHFYGAAQVNVPMGGPMDAEMSNTSPDAWYPGGSIIPIN
jgi:hypothetical protein